MKELSLHILDIGQNSVSAGATEVELIVTEDLSEDILYIRIADNGCGMDAETVAKVIDPFYTSRTTRKVGLGVPMFKINAEQCGGWFRIDSEPGKGTTVEAQFKHSHIDRVPLGNMPDTVMMMVMANPQGELLYKHTLNGREFIFDTREVRIALGDEVPLDTLDVLMWIKDYIREGLTEIHE